MKTKLKRNYKDLYIDIKKQHDKTKEKLTKTEQRLRNISQLKDNKQLNSLLVENRSLRQKVRLYEEIIDANRYTRHI